MYAKYLRFCKQFFACPAKSCILKKILPHGCSVLYFYFRPRLFKLSLLDIQNCLAKTDQTLPVACHHGFNYVFFSEKFSYNFEYSRHEVNCLAKIYNEKTVLYNIAV